MKFRRLEDVIKKKNGLKGKTALVRVDFNAVSYTHLTLPTILLV